MGLMSPYRHKRMFYVEKWITPINQVHDLDRFTLDFVRQSTKIVIVMITALETLSAQADEHIKKGLLTLLPTISVGSFMISE